MTIRSPLRPSARALLAGIAAAAGRPPRRTLRTALAASAALLSATALGVVLPAAPALAADSATINGAIRRQTIAGFGVSEGFGEAATVMNASSSVQQQALS